MLHVLVTPRGDLDMCARKARSAGIAASGLLATGNITGGMHITQHRALHARQRITTLVCTLLIGTNAHERPNINLSFCHCFYLSAFLLPRLTTAPLVPLPSLFQSTWRLAVQRGIDPWLLAAHPSVSVAIPRSQGCRSLAQP